MRAFNDIALLKVNYLRGPGIWTYREVLEVWLDLGELEEYPSNKIPGFPERLKSWLPGLIEHHCGVGERGGFLLRLHEGTWPGHILEHIIIELLNLAGMPTAFGQTRETSKSGTYRMVFRAKDEQVARVALAQGHRLIMAAINDQPFDVGAAVAAIREVIDDRYLGPTTAAIVDAAFERRIPTIRLNDGNLVQIGYGAAQRRIWTAETQFTSAIAEGIASHKNLTRKLLQSCGVPVPEGQVVGSAEQAWEAAQELGLPVVVKPLDGNRGRGVSLKLERQDEIEAAWRIAEPEGSDVIVEQFIPGEEHRLLVVDGKVVAAARGQTVFVTGDGQASVRELIAVQLNADPDRGWESPLEQIDVDRNATVRLELERQELHADAVPEAGRKVIIQRNGNVAIDCTDEVHPDVAYHAQLAARIVGLDIAGIDIVAQDIARPLAQQHGAIVEVNAGPSLLMHVRPTVGSPQPVGQAIVQYLFPPPSAQEGNTDTAGRIPIIGIAGRHGAAGIARLVAWLLHLGGRRTGVASQQGIFLDRRQVDRRDSAHWEAGNRLLMNQQIEVAVIENGPRSILAEGLAYDRCHIGLVTDMDGFEELAEFDIQEREQMTRVLRTQVDVVLASGIAILNADDAQVADLARLSDGGVCYYSGSHALFEQASAARDATAASAEPPAFLPAADWLVPQGDALQWHRGDGSTATIADWQNLQRHAATLGLAPPQLLAAIATALAMQIAPELIAAGIRTFEPQVASPGA